MNFEETMGMLKEKIGSGKLDGTAVYQFCLSGDNGGDVHVKVVDGVGQMEQGLADSPDITVSMTDEDFAGLLTGKLNAMSAFMAGKIKVKGDMKLAMKLQNMLG